MPHESKPKIYKGLVLAMKDRADGDGSRENLARASPNVRNGSYEKAQKDYDQAHSTRVLRDYAECVVRTNPAGSRDLLQTEPDSAGETAGFETLQPALEHCLQQGSVAFGRLIFRGTIALNFYRLAHARDPRRLQ